MNERASGARAIGMRSESYWNKERTLLERRARAIGMKSKNYWNVVLKHGKWSDLQGHHITEELIQTFVVILAVSSTEGKKRKVDDVIYT